MCQTLPTPQANLICYYHLDEGSGLTAYDASGNGNTGTLQNFATSVTSSWPYSGAAIGDTSIYLYSPSSWTGQSLSLSSLSNEGSIAISNVQGNPDGVQLFRVNYPPSQAGNLTHPINTYFGTFVVNGASPTYTTTYNYAGSIFDGFPCESDYSLYQRTDNSVANWAPLTDSLNTTAKTLTVANIASREEIILDTACGTTLPVTSVITASHADNNITIYPNPGSGVFHIVASEPISGSINVIDMYGNNIYQYTSINKSSTVTLDLSFLFDGVYFVRINTASDVSISKLVIDK